MFVGEGYGACVIFDPIRKYVARMLHYQNKGEITRADVWIDEYKSYLLGGYSV